MSAIPECVNCGGKDFFVESGFYFCSECQIQSQDVREQELATEQYVHGHKSKIASASPSKSLKEEIIAREGKELTSWELANVVLAGLTNEVVSLSGEKAVKNVTLQLWASYLRALEVAFISSTTERPPRLQLAFKAKDAELIYGTSTAGANAYKRAFSTRSSKSGASKKIKSSRTRRKSRKILKAAQLDYSESNLSTSFSSLSSANTSKLEEETISRVKWSKDATKQLKELIDEPEETRAVKARKQKKKIIDSVKHLSMTKAIAILRLGIMLGSKKILYSDLIRWDEEGYLSMSQMTRLVPKDCRVSGDLNVLLQQEPKSQERLVTICASLLRFLGIEHIKVDFPTICHRIVRRLHLPEETVDICQAFIRMSKLNKNLKMQLSCEARAAALIIFILKFLYGLDDLTEYRNSESIKIINREQGTNLFVWTDWQKSVEHRLALEAETSVMGRSYFSINRVDTFIGQWRPPSRKLRFSSKRDVGEKLRTSIDRVLEPLSAAGREPKGPSPLIPDHPPNGDSLKLFLDYGRMGELARASGVKLEKWSARKTARADVIEINTCSESARSLTGLHTAVIEEGLTKKEDELMRTRYTYFKRACTHGDKWYIEDTDCSLDEAASVANENANKAVPFKTRKIIQSEPKLYFPSMDYTMFHVSSHDDNKISIEEFDELARCHLSSSLYWLLSEMARSCRLSLKTIYFRLISIEKAFLRKGAKRKLVPW